MPPMIFDYMSWEAFATLLTGVLAVTAALIVGTKQTQIQTKQVLIQNRLADLEEFKLRQALFEERYKVYNASRKWLVATLKYGRPPYPTNDLSEAQRELEHKLADEFFDALDRSRFLFPPGVREVLFKMWSAGKDLTHSDNTLERDTSTQEQRGKAADKHDEAFNYLKGLLPDFSKLFGDDLILSAPHHIATDCENLSR